MKPLDIKQYAGESRKSVVCSWTRVCRSCPYILVVISLIILCLTAFFKYAALDWIIDQQVEQVHINTATFYLLYYFDLNYGKKLRLKSNEF